MLRYSGHNIKVKGIFVYAKHWLRNKGCLCYDAACAFYCDYDIAYSDELNTYVQYFHSPVSDEYGITLTNIKRLPISPKTT